MRSNPLIHAVNTGESMGCLYWQETVTGRRPLSEGKIQPYVVAVNISGMRTDEEIIYPSQGDSELSMMRTIQQSGWRGPIGLIAEKGGDAENTLKSYLVGLHWLVAEIRQPGSGGPQPFASVR